MLYSCLEAIICNLPCGHTNKVIKILVWSCSQLTVKPTKHVVKYNLVFMFDRFFCI